MRHNQIFIERQAIYDLISWLYFKKMGRNKANLSKREKEYILQQWWRPLIRDWVGTRCAFFKYYKLRVKLVHPEWAVTYDNKGYMG